MIAADGWAPAGPTPSSGARRLLSTTRAPDLQLRLLGPRHAPLQADPMRLAQILTNLLDNACHAAGPCGTVCIEIVHDGAGWRTEVIDDGPGVAVEDREPIFDPLVRIDASRSRHTGGFGLGLSIARELARAHGGDLRCVDSGRDHGARLRLTLPADARPTGPAARSGLPAAARVRMAPSAQLIRRQ